MSVLQPFISTTIHVDSPENISSTGNSIAIPIVVAASVVSVGVFLSLVFVVFYLIRRRYPRQDISDSQGTNYYLFDKDNYLPPEPSPPPPPYKGVNNEPDVEAGPRPMLPPKEIGRPFVTMKRTIERWSWVSETPASRVDPSPVALPKQALVKG